MKINDLKEKANNENFELLIHCYRQKVRRWRYIDGEYQSKVYDMNISKRFIQFEAEKWAYRINKEDYKQFLKIKESKSA